MTEEDITIFEKVKAKSKANEKILEEIYVKGKYIPLTPNPNNFCCFSKIWNSWYPSVYNVEGGSYFININKEIVVIDPGFNTFDHIKSHGLDIRFIKHIFITHFHPDHFASIIPLLTKMESKNIKRFIYMNPTCYKQFSVYQWPDLVFIEIQPEMKSKLIFDSIIKYPSDFDDNENELVLGEEDYEVEFNVFRAFHREIGGGSHSLSLIFNIKHKTREKPIKIGILGDTDGHPTYIPEYCKNFKGCDILVLHLGALHKDPNGYKHLYWKGLVKLIEEINEKKDQDHDIIFVIGEFGFELSHPNALSNALDLFLLHKDGQNENINRYISFINTQDLYSSFPVVKTYIHWLKQEELFKLFYISADIIENDPDIVHSEDYFFEITRNLNFFKVFTQHIIELSIPSIEFEKYKKDIIQLSGPNRVTFEKMNHFNEFLKRYIQYLEKEDYKDLTKVCNQVQKRFLTYIRKNLIKPKYERLIPDYKSKALQKDFINSVFPNNRILLKYLFALYVFDTKQFVTISNENFNNEDLRMVTINELKSRFSNSRFLITHPSIIYDLSVDEIKIAGFCSNCGKVQNIDFSTNYDYKIVDVKKNGKINNFTEKVEFNLESCPYCEYLNGPSDEELYGDDYQDYLDERRREYEQEMNEIYQNFEKWEEEIISYLYIPYYEEKGGYFYEINRKIFDIWNNRREKRNQTLISKNTFISIYHKFKDQKSSNIWDFILYTLFIIVFCINNFL